MGKPSNIRTVLFKGFISIAYAVCCVLIVLMPVEPNPLFWAIHQKPGAVQRHLSDERGDSTSFARQDSPIVVQARILAHRLNPPRVPDEQKTATSQDVVTVKRSLSSKKLPIQPKSLTPKFRVLATSISKTDNGKALALIEQAGVRKQWVTIGDALGHFEVIQIERGKLLCSLGDRVHVLSMRDGPPAASETKTRTAKVKAPQKPEKAVTEKPRQEVRTRPRPKRYVVSRSNF